jgi:hypothetical protein
LDKILPVCEVVKSFLHYQLHSRNLRTQQYQSTCRAGILI